MDHGTDDRKVADLMIQASSGRHFIVLKRIPYRILNNSFELMVASVGLLAGFPLLLGPPYPGIIDNLLPTWLVALWSIQLVSGCLLVLLGLFKGSPKEERFGLSVLSPASLVYAVAVIFVLGQEGILAAIPYVLFSAACTLRWYILGVSLCVRERLCRNVPRI
jgi:hypothetical protein